MQTIGKKKLLREHVEKYHKLKFFDQISKLTFNYWRKYIWEKHFSKQLPINFCKQHNLKKRISSALLDKHYYSHVSTTSKRIFVKH